MTPEETLETMMLTCFSVVWALSIWHMLRARHDCWLCGEFLVPLGIGYGGCLLGLGAKLTLWLGTGMLGWLAFVYAWTLVVAVVDRLVMRRVPEVRRHEPVMRRPLVPTGAMG
ncbi:MAG: hypothetical protein AAFZ09_17795 [Pseudomonadota bacterium]